MTLFSTNNELLTTLIWSFAILVNFTLNPVHAAIYLIFTFILSSMVLFNLGFILISYTYIIVYVGAIAILFLFIVMLLDLQSLKNPIVPFDFWYKFYVFGLFVLAYQFIKTLVVDVYKLSATSSTKISAYQSDITFKFLQKSESSVFYYLKNGIAGFDKNKILGFYLYNENGLLVLALGLLLFLSMVLAIYLVKPIKSTSK